MIVRLIIGAIFVGIGFLFVKKPDFPYEYIGELEIAAKFGTNSRSFYKLIGIVFILVGFMIWTNLHGQFALWLGGLFS